LETNFEFLTDIFFHNTFPQAVKNSEKSVAFMHKKSKIGLEILIIGNFLWISL